MSGSAAVSVLLARATQYGAHVKVGNGQNGALTVQQVYIGTYKFDIKGVLIAETSKGYPDDEVYRLRMLFESAAPVRLINAVSDLFMDNSRNVCITDIDFPDAPAQELRCRPFTLSCESDSVTNLLVQ